jgi:hypothetical protein
MFDLESSVVDFCRKTKQEPKTIELKVYVIGTKEVPNYFSDIIYTRNYKVIGLKNVGKLMWDVNKEVHGFFERNAVDEVGIVITNPKTNLCVFHTIFIGLARDDRLIDYTIGNWFEEVERDLKWIDAHKELGGFDDNDHEEIEMKVYYAWVENNRNIQAVPENLIKDYFEH